MERGRVGIELRYGLFPRMKLWYFWVKFEIDAAMKLVRKHDSAKRMDTRVFDMNLRVLLYGEDGQHHARCLEMDLLGTGKTERMALNALREMIEEHISFAVFKKDDGLIMFPAEREYFDRWDKANTFRLHNELFPDRAVKLNGKAAFITFSRQEVERLKKRRPFSREPALAQT